MQIIRFQLQFKIPETLVGTVGGGNLTFLGLALHSKHKNEVTMVSLRQRSVIFATFLVAFCGLGLLAGGLGTRYWVVAQAEKETSDKASGFIHFGLFEGTKRLDHGWGERSVPMDIVEILYRERTFMVKELWVGTIVFICVAMLFGIIAAFAAIINTAHNPVEPICHIPGKIHYFVIEIFQMLNIFRQITVLYAPICFDFTK